MVAAGAAGFVGGAIVGAGAMYMWNRMDSYNMGSFKNRLYKAGAHSGDITISLMWDTRDDLDLWVVSPYGDEIWYGNKRSRDGGWLDVDMNVRHNTQEPVENVAWDVAPVGRYEVRVKFFSRSMWSSDPVDFVVLLRVVPTISSQQWPPGCEMLETSSSGSMVRCDMSIADSGDTEGVTSFSTTNQAQRSWCIAPAGLPQAGELMDCEVCKREKPAGSTCADGSACLTKAGCDITLSNPMIRDDIMEAVFTPQSFEAPLTLIVKNISGEDFAEDALCSNETTAESRIYITLTALEHFGCDRNLWTSCTAATETGCYDNEVCENSVCKCETGACLDESNMCVWVEAGLANAAPVVGPDLPLMLSVLLIAVCSSVRGRRTW